MRKQINFRAEEKTIEKLNSIAQEFNNNITDTLSYMIENYQRNADAGKPRVWYSEDNMAVILKNPFWKNDPQFVINSLIRREAVKMEDYERTKISQAKMNPAMARFMSTDTEPKVERKDMGDVSYETDIQ